MKWPRGGGYDDWTDSPEGALALIIILDQFSRNLYRNSPQAFAQDRRCAQITHEVMDKGLDQKMPEDLRVFCYMPLMHSEDLEDQELCVKVMNDNGYEANISFAEDHRDIIKRFGRFPHRNAALGRETTEEEKQFLDDGGFSG